MPQPFPKHSRLSRLSRPSPRIAPRTPRRRHVSRWKPKRPNPFWNSVKVWICAILLLGIGGVGAVMKADYASLLSLGVPLIPLTALLVRDFHRARTFDKEHNQTAP
ncbi:MAG: hypothetical protein EOP85_04165 [Verrucomicrobiaceae bacterium]|nr:MAG: hypothetical protein EOP85_04165 [Verrucomicrobiaceae bacterium]